MPPTRRVDSQLLSLAVHEFRTPITIVGGYLRMILRSPSEPLSDGQRRMIEEAERSCGRLAALVAELSDLSNLMVGTATFNRHEVDIFPLLDEAAAHLASSTGLPVIVRGTDAKAVAMGDAARLRHAFAAIIAALRRELLPDVPLIVERQIRRSRQQRSAVIGIGFGLLVPRLIAARARPLKAFNVWRGGAGLALVIAEQVIAAHGGKLGAPARTAPTQPGAAIVLPLKS